MCVCEWARVVCVSVHASFDGVCFCLYWRRREMRENEGERRSERGQEPHGVRNKREVMKVFSLITYTRQGFVSLRLSSSLFFSCLKAHNLISLFHFSWLPHSHISCCFSARHQNSGCFRRGSCDISVFTGSNTVLPYNDFLFLKKLLWENFKEGMFLF